VSTTSEAPTEAPTEALTPSSGGLAGLPAFRKTYLIGSRDDIRVPMREVALTTGDKVVLYDTSGPYTDAAVGTDIRRGLEPVRAAWIAERDDVEAYDGRPTSALDDGYSDDARRERSLRNLDAVFAARGERRPLRAKDPARAVTQLAYARRGEITPERCGRGSSPGSCARRSRAAARSCPPTSTTPRPSR
jgi:phosphomethylpyrimidine synthase